MSSCPVVDGNYSIGAEGLYLLGIGQIDHVTKHLDAQRFARFDHFLRTSQRGDDLIDLHFQECLQLRLVLRVRLVDNQVDTKGL